MDIKVEKKAVRMLWGVLAVGIVSGLLNGFLGAGSGIVLMYMTAIFNKDKSEGAAKDNFATVVACVLVLSVVSAVIYSRKGSVSASLVGRFAIPAIMGGVIGASLTEKLNPKILRITFAVVVIIAGINMSF